MIRLSFRTWGPYWAAGALCAIVTSAARALWPHSAVLAAMVSIGFIPVALIWIAHRVEQRYRRPGNLQPSAHWASPDQAPRR